MNGDKREDTRLRKQVQGLSARDLYCIGSEGSKFKGGSRGDRERTLSRLFLFLEKQFTSPLSHSSSSTSPSLSFSLTVSSSSCLLFFLPAPLLFFLSYTLSLSPSFFPSALSFLTPTHVLPLPSLSHTLNASCIPLHDCIFSFYVCIQYVYVTVT